MSKEWSKVIINKSKLRNSYIKWPSHENFSAFKEKKNFCNNLSKKKIKRNYLTKITSRGVTGNKRFWNSLNLFLKSKGFLHCDDI